MAFDHTKHPRGHPNNAGSFSEVQRTESAGSLMGVESWPPVAYEPLTWTSRIATSGVHASWESSPTTSYEASVPPFIADLDMPLTSSLAGMVDEATDFLIKFDAQLGNEIAPFATLLLRSEAVASSQIEHLTASARQILNAELGVKAKPNATMIAANTLTMRAAIDLASDLTTNTVLHTHGTLMEEDPHHEAGVFRTEPVWIGTDYRSPVGATFVAPVFERVPGLVDDVMAFARRIDLPRLAQVAVAHAQFETIHPFTDGNGRTGRALMQAMLRGKGVTSNVTVPVSAGLLTDTSSYHRALTAYREGDIRPIVELTAKASVDGVRRATGLVNDIRAVQETWRSLDSLKGIRSNSGVWRALDVIARQPVINASTLAREMGLSRSANAYPFINTLEEAGILKGKDEYQSGRLYRSDEILKVLDEFAADSGRRD